MVDHNSFNDEASAPTLYLAQKWLREEKHIVVEPYCNSNGYNCDVTKPDGSSLIYFENCYISNNGGMFDKYEDALINALKWTCKYLFKLETKNK